MGEGGGRLCGLFKQGGDPDFFFLLFFCDPQKTKTKTKKDKEKKQAKNKKRNKQKKKRAARTKRLLLVFFLFKLLKNVLIGSTFFVLIAERINKKKKTHLSLWGRFFAHLTGMKDCRWMKGGKEKAMPEVGSVQVEYSQFQWDRVCSLLK